MKTKFGENLDKALKKYNLTVAALSKKTGISSNTLYSIIRRKSNKIDPSVLKKICDNTDITIYDLIDDPQLTAWASTRSDAEQNYFNRYFMNILEMQSSLNEPANSSSTIAAHFNADEYTPEELEEIRQFAEFVKARRKLAEPSAPSDQDE